MEPTVIIPVDHSVALDVREGDYFGINVKYAKKAGEVESLPELKTIQTDDDVVAFKMGDESYSKRINNVESANTALYDKKGRDLSLLASEQTYTTLVDNYLAGKQLVLSVNGMTGNVTLPIAALHSKDRELQEAIDAVDTDLGVETERLESEISEISNDVEAFSDSLSTALLNIDNLSDLTLEHSNSISNIEVSIDEIESEQTSQNTTITQNTNDITTLKQDCTSLESTVDSLNGTVNTQGNRITALESAASGIVSESTIDSKIADAMANEQIQDEALSARMDNLESQIEHYDDSELQTKVSALQAENAVLSTQLGTAQSNITTLQNQVAELQTAIAGFDFSQFVTTETADATYKNKAEANAEHADLQQQITDNIGRVLTADPSENNRVWVEQA